MDATPSIKPKTMAELLPGLRSILSKDSIQFLSVQKQPRQTMIAQTRMADTVVKPLTMAEMRANILTLKPQSPRSFAQGVPSTKKKTWNSSVKVDGKIVSHTAKGQLKNHPVRKVLNFQPKPNLTLRATMATETPKFARPEIRAKRPTHRLQGCSNPRISGVAAISDTPLVNVPNRRTMTANKENMSNQNNIKRCILPKFISQKKQISKETDTPLSNTSWKSGSDASFLLKEKEINDDVEKSKALSAIHKLDNIVEVTPPVSTPFREYRNVPDFFNPSTELDNSDIPTYNDDTIMFFTDSASKDKDYDVAFKDGKGGTSIVSLVDLLSNVSITENVIHKSLQPSKLEQIEAAALRNIKVIDETIATLKKLKESQEGTLSYLKEIKHDANKHGAESKLAPKHSSSKVTPNSMNARIKPIQSVHIQKVESQKKADFINPLNQDADLPEGLDTALQMMEPKEFNQCNKTKHTAERSAGKSKSAAKSPSYKIPHRKMCLRKSLLFKSVPDIPRSYETPVKSNMGGQALNMYMKMKKHMNFLNTPVLKHRVDVPDSPAITSLNLQKQLDELYNK